jgi:hypothetical protein
MAETRRVRAVCAATVGHSPPNRFHYDYDVRGNWIKKVVAALAGADQDFSVSSVEHRTLAYYD